MGVGKSYVMLNLLEEGLFPLDSFTIIDPDKLKSELPEMKGYCDFDPETAATKLHRESTMMADVLFEHGLGMRKNLLIDGSLRDVNWYKELFVKLRREQPHCRIGIIHVVADRETIISRAHSRAKLSNRVVPMELLEESMAQVPKSVSTLAPLSDI
jgi:hypothetical protein